MLWGRIWYSPWCADQQTGNLAGPHCRIDSKSAGADKQVTRSPGENRFLAEHLAVLCTGQNLKQGLKSNPIIFSTFVFQNPAEHVYSQSEQSFGWPHMLIQREFFRFTIMPVTSNQTPGKCQCKHAH